MTKLVRPLHVLESWAPVTTGYTMRSGELIAAQERSEDIEPRVLVSSRQFVYRDGSIESGAAGADLGDRVRVCAPSDRERLLRKARGFAVDRAGLRRSIERAIDELGADLVHVHWSSGIGAAAAAAARNRGLPLVAEVRFDLAGAVTAQTARIPNAWARERLETRLRAIFEGHLDRADAIVAASPSLAELLERAVPGARGRVIVAANGCDPERFFPGPADPGLRERYGLTGRTVVGTTSTMLRYEGLDLLLDAARECSMTRDDLSVLLIGDGPERARLTNQAEKLGLRCVFTGRVTAAEMNEHYRLVDVMVLPRLDAAVTRYAGPLKLLEALASGRACLGSAVGDITELLGQDRGVLVPAEDRGALRAGMAELIDNPTRRAELGRRARAYAVDAGTWRSAVQGHRRAYAQLGLLEPEGARNRAS